MGSGRWDNAEVPKNVVVLIQNMQKVNELIKNVMKLFVFLSLYPYIMKVADIHVLNYVKSIMIL